MNEDVTMTRGQLLLLIAVIAYWLSPIDAMPGLPIDDLVAAWLAWVNREELAPYLERLADQVLGGEQ